MILRARGLRPTVHGLEGTGCEPYRASVAARSLHYADAVILYTCPHGKILGDLPGPVSHPCGKAAKALDDAGHRYELKKVKGGRAKPWTWRSRAHDRAEIERVSGQRAVPILVLDNGNSVVGSGEIVRWAKANVPASATS